MSLVPLVFSNWWEDLVHPHHLLDQDFGVGLHPGQLLSPQIQRYFPPIEHLSHRNPAYYRPWGELLRNADAGASTITNDKDKFQVILDVQQFKPDEIKVKIVDKSVIVEAKHEEKKDEHGWISRQFVRKYIIPEQCDINLVNSSLSSDGVLTITAPRKDVPMVENERKIQIEHTGKPAIRHSSVKDSQKKGSKKEEKMEA